MKRKTAMAAGLLAAVMLLGGGIESRAASTSDILKAAAGFERVMQEAEAKEDGVELSLLPITEPDAGSG